MPQKQHLSTQKPVQRGPMMPDIAMNSSAPRVLKMITYEKEWLTTKFPAITLAKPNKLSRHHALVAIYM